ncbi:tumor protein D52 [Suricata suricatta]|nr:tumor protein D52 [Suricata suricatta]
MDCREMDFYEDYQSPFDFDTGVNKNYLYLSPSGNWSPSGSPTLQKSDWAPVYSHGMFDCERTLPVTCGHVTYCKCNSLCIDDLPGTKGLSTRGPFPSVGLPLALFFWLSLLSYSVEEEIQTLSQVLAAKEKHLAEIKRKLGINSLQELKQNIAKGWQDVTATSAYKKTSETLHVYLFLMLPLSIRSIQHSISMPAMRNSPTFKSFEEKVENLKSKVGGTKPAGGDFGEVLNSTANASATSTEPLPEQTQGGQ